MQRPPDALILQKLASRNLIEVDFFIQVPIQRAPPPALNISRSVYQRSGTPTRMHMHVHCNDQIHYDGRRMGELSLVSCRYGAPSRRRTASLLDWFSQEPSRSRKCINYSIKG